MTLQETYKPWKKSVHKIHVRLQSTCNGIQKTVVHALFNLVTCLFSQEQQTETRQEKKHCRSQNLAKTSERERKAGSSLEINNKYNGIISSISMMTFMVINPHWLMETPVVIVALLWLVIYVLSRTSSLPRESTLQVDRKDILYFLFSRWVTKAQRDEITFPRSVPELRTSTAHSDPQQALKLNRI